MKSTCNLCTWSGQRVKHTLYLGCTRGILDIKGTVWIPVTSTTEAATAPHIHTENTHNLVLVAMFSLLVVIPCTVSWGNPMPLFRPCCLKTDLGVCWLVPCDFSLHPHPLSTGLPNNSSCFASTGAVVLWGNWQGFISLHLGKMGAVISVPRATLTWFETAMWNMKPEAYFYPTVFFFYLGSQSGGMEETSIHYSCSGCGGWGAGLGCTNNSTCLSGQTVFYMKCLPMSDRTSVKSVQ